jgi:malonyl-CoA decarboxylase
LAVRGCCTAPRLPCRSWRRQRSGHDALSALAAAGLLIAGAGRGSGRDLIEGAADALRAELPHLHTFITLSPVPGLRAWVEANGAEVEPVGDELAGLGARYLTSLDEVGRPLDPVARFHLSNGARLWRVNPDGDPSALGVERSFGLLANYRYLPEDRAANRDLLADGTVPVGDAVGALLDAPRSANDHRA